jgi:transcriptional regulator with XRE-family HTH domain
VRYSKRMAPGFDWYLKEWLATLGKRQADIVRDLGWNKARVSLMLRGKQPYDRDSLNELATYLHLFPHELLMHPDEAMALRQLKVAAGQIVRIPFAGTAGEEPDEKAVSVA